MKYELNFRNNYGTDQELLEDLKRVAQKLGTPRLTALVYSEHGKYSGDTIGDRFNGWNKALLKAGLEITITQKATEQELFENIEKVWIFLGRQPGKRDLKRPLSNFSETAYRTKFGSWRKALECFIKFINSDSKEVSSEGLELDVNIPSTENIEFFHRTKRNPSERLKVQVLMRDGNKCRLCGIILTGENIHFDH